MKGSTEKQTQPAAKAQKHSIMLGAGIKRYVLADTVEGNKGGKLYEAGVEYPVTGEERAKLFRITNDEGVRVFYDAELIKEQMRHANKKRRQQLANAGDEEAQLAIAQESLVDTGAVKLEGDNGEQVGVNT